MLLDNLAMNPLFDNALAKLDGLDPYLIWGAFTQFCGSIGLPSNGVLTGRERVHFLVECTAEFANPWLVANPDHPFDAEHTGAAAHLVAAGKNTGDYIYSVSTSVATLFTALKDLGGPIKRIELSTARKAPPDLWTQNLKPPLIQPVKTAAKNVLLIIDDGLAFLNQCFRRKNGETCVAWFWDQSTEKTVYPKPPGMMPASQWQPVYRFGYGCELDAKAINALIKTLDPSEPHTSEHQTYRRLNYTRVQRDLAHGTHVAGWACEGHEDDVDIIMVQLPPVVAWDTSGGGTAKHVCDALGYALDRIDPTANIVVNLSFGASAGPHDGSTLLESAIDQLIKAQQKNQRNFAMTLPAGNQFNARCHAAVTLAAGTSETLDWNIQKGDPTETFCELWYQRGLAISVSLASPAGHKLGPVFVGQSTTGTSGNQLVCAAIHQKIAASGNGLSQVLLAVVPAESDDVDDLLAPAGVWKIEISNTGSGPVTVDAWIQRDDGVLQGQYQSRQSYFSPTRADLKGSDDDVAGDPVKRSGTGNNIGHGRETIIVGGCFSDTRLLTNYTSAKPTHLVRQWPDFLAPCDDNHLLGGRLGQATTSGSKVRMNGTSISAPQVANRILSIFKQPANTGKASLTTEELRGRIPAAHIGGRPNTSSPTNLDNLRTGRGCIRL